MMKIFIILIFIISVQSLVLGQDSLCQKRVNFSLDVGMSVVYPKDKSLRVPTGFEELDAREVVNAGFKVSLNLFHKKIIKPKLTIGANTFRTQATDLDTNFFTNAIAFKNRFVSYNAELLAVHDFQTNSHHFSVELGMFYDQQILLFPYGKLITGEEIRGIEDTPGRTRLSSFYRGPVNVGSVIGVSYPLKKIKLSLFYYQRLYFTGFNREISRVMLRVGF